MDTTSEDERSVEGTTWVRKPEIYRVTAVLVETPVDTVSDGETVAVPGEYLLEGITTGELEVVSSVVDLKADFQEVEDWDGDIPMAMSEQILQLGESLADVTARLEALEARRGKPAVGGDDAYVSPVQ